MRLAKAKAKAAVATTETFGQRGGTSYRTHAQGSQTLNSPSGDWKW